MNDDEIVEDDHWRRVVSFPGHTVSDQGDIYSEERLEVLPARLDSNGKLVVSLKAPYRRSEHRLVDHLVAEAFLPTPEGGTRWRKLRHIDGDLLNNSPENLEWRERGWPNVSKNDG